MVKEIPQKEYDSRIRGLTQAMERIGLDAIILLNSQNWTYFVGYRESWDPIQLEWHRCAIIPKVGEPHFIAPSMVSGLVAEYSWLQPSSIREYSPTDDANPYELTVKLLNDLGLENKAIGVEFGSRPRYSFCSQGANFIEFDSIRESLPNVRFIDASEIIWDQRRIKTPWEVETYRTLADITTYACKSALEHAEEGVSVSEVHKMMIMSALSKGGTDVPTKGMHSLTYFPAGGGKFREQMIRPSVYGDRVLGNGDEIFLDGGPSFKGYISDIQRNAVIGNPSPYSEKLHQQSIVGIEAMESILKPGVKASDLYRAAFKAMKDFDPNSLVPFASFGHGIGLRAQEPPSIALEDDTAMQPGMIFTLEPPAFPVPRSGKYPNEWVLDVLWQHVEDIYLMTHDGYECLTDNCDRGLWVK